MTARWPAVTVCAAFVACSEPTGPEREISGARLYDQYCARCHGVDGRPTPAAPQARDLSNRAIVDDLSDMRIKHMIERGEPPNMPGFAGQFTEASLMVLVAYVRSLSGSPGDHARPPADDDAP